MGDQIYDFEELWMEEVQSSRLLTEYLERPELLSEIKTEFRERKQKEKEVSF